MCVPAGIEIHIQKYSHYCPRQDCTNHLGLAAGTCEYLWSGQKMYMRNSSVLHRVSGVSVVDVFGPPRVLLDLSTGYMRHTSERTDRPKFVHIHAITHSSSHTFTDFGTTIRRRNNSCTKKIDISRWVGPPHSRQLAHKQHSARTASQRRDNRSGLTQTENWEERRRSLGRSCALPLFAMRSSLFVVVRIANKHMLFVRNVKSVYHAVLEYNLRWGEIVASVRENKFIVYSVDNHTRIFSIKYKC